MFNIYRQDDARADALAGRTVGVVGYGQTGRALALNLRDSGARVIAGVLENVPDTALSPYDDAQLDPLKNGTVAEADGFEVMPVEALTRRANIILLTLPDESMIDVYIRHISPHLTSGHALIFTSAYNVAFGYIEPPPFIDVGIVAPRLAGERLRQQYTSKVGFYSYIAVWQDASRNAWELVLGVADAIGSLRAGAVEISAEQEAQLSLFVQQALVPVLYHAMTTAASLLMREGYLPSAALTDLYLGGRFNDFVQRAASRGLLMALRDMPLTAQYGSLSRLERFNELKLERLMEITLEEIRQGDFAREWAEEYEDGHPRLDKLIQQQEIHDLWDWEQQTLDQYNFEAPGE
jgi:ketol-acid reductoisomerase